MTHITKNAKDAFKAMQVPFIGMVFFVMPASITIIFFPQLITRLLPINLFYTLLSVFFILSPFSKLRFCHPKQDRHPEQDRHPGLDPGSTHQYNKTIWLLLIMSIELFAIILFSNILQTSTAYLTQSQILLHYEIPNLKQVTTTLLLHWGLFPWSLYGILAGILAYAYFKEEKPGLFSACVPPLKSVYLDRQVRRGINIFSSTMTNIAFSIVLVISILQLNIFLLHLLQLDDTNNIHMGGIICYTLVTMLLLTPSYDYYVAFVARRYLRAAAYVIPFIVAVLLILLLSTFVGQLLYNQAIEAIKQAESWQTQLHILNHDWHLFYWAWWICSAPLTCSMIARVSRGRSLRELLGGTMLLPALIALALLITQYAPESEATALLHSLFQIIQIITNNHVFSLIGPVSFLVFMLTIKDSRFAIFGFMPYKKAYVTARPMKNKHYMKTLLQFTAMMITGFLIANLRSIQYLASLGAIPGTVFFTLCCLGFYSMLVKQLWHQ